jgi:hypothetical protein
MGERTFQRVTPLGGWRVADIGLRRSHDRATRRDRYSQSHDGAAARFGFDDQTTADFRCAFTHSDKPEVSAVCP